MNPPYGERLSEYDLEQLYGMIGSTLKFHFTGAQAWIIAHQVEQFHAIGLKPDMREKLYNGALECELRGYTLFAGKHKEYKELVAERGESQETRRSNYSETHQRRERHDKPYGKKSYDKKSYDKKPYGKKTYDRASSGRHRSRGNHAVGSSARLSGANIQAFGSDETFVHEVEAKDNE